jgi:hypothetical protein
MSNQAKSDLASREGYVALGLVALMLLAPDLPGNIGFLVGISIWGCSWLFAIGGVRRGRGGARVAATIALSLLILHAASALLLAFH